MGVMQSASTADSGKLLALRAKSSMVVGLCARLPARLSGQMAHKRDMPITEADDGSGAFSRPYICCSARSAVFLEAAQMLNNKPLMGLPSNQVSGTVALRLHNSCHLTRCAQTGTRPVPR